MVAIILNHPVIFGMCVVVFVALCAGALLVVELANSVAYNYRAIRLILGPDDHSRSADRLRPQRRDLRS
jgi:hypothetical protein